MKTSRNGTSPMLLRPVSTIRATHSVMMSRLVIRTLVGYQYFRDSVFSGQPSVECGQRADENHVSNTSGSCTKPAASILAVSSGSSSERQTNALPSTVLGSHHR